MIEIRFAEKEDCTSQKELWKLCFGDEDKYIEFYYNHRYKKEDTILLLIDGKIVSMLTLIPTTMITPDNQGINAAMLYAIATHPEYRHRGFAARLMKFTHRYLRENKINISMLVPATRNLFDFYEHQGYQAGFYIRENIIRQNTVECLSAGETERCFISTASPQEYNLRRNQYLRGTYYIAYHEQEIIYQKMLSELSGADIYAIDIEEMQGCAAIERITAEKVLIKEILLPDRYIQLAIKQIGKRIPAKEYLLRMPGSLKGKHGGLLRSFGMFRMDQDSALTISPQHCGYLGLAFD